MRVGIDILHISRIKNIADDEIKMSTLFTPKEIKYFNKFKDKYEHVAGGFCAKEAIAKAMGTGFNEKVRPLNIEVLHGDQGAPYVVLHDETKDVFVNQNCGEISISISHDGDIATAICVIK